MPVRPVKKLTYSVPEAPAIDQMPAPSFVPVFFEREAGTALR